MTFTEKNEELRKLVTTARATWVPGESTEEYSKLLLTLEFVVQLTSRMQNIVNGFTTENDKEQCEPLAVLLLERDRLINAVTVPEATDND